MKKKVVILFGGESAEHEVSIITGLQIVEKIDRVHYEPHVVYVGKNGEMWYMGELADRKSFLGARKRGCSFGKDAAGGYIAVAGSVPGLGGKKIYPYAAFCAFHGGTGESGHYQGVLEASGIPHTGASTESAVIAMNKRLTSEVLATTGVSMMRGVAIRSEDALADSLSETRRTIEVLGLPVIVKPVHLGSSIAISIARDEAALERALIEAARLDSEVLVEQLLTDFVEYNVSLRVHNGVLECSPIERPVSKDEILSFADKYQRGGGKKNGASGMASLDREVPAQIPTSLKERIEGAAQRAYRACRLAGVPRIDFMYQKSTDSLFLTEINPIPGSCAFYLWEAAGIPFETQISHALEQAVLDEKERASRRFDYSTDIVTRFCA